MTDETATDGAEDEAGADSKDGESPKSGRRIPGKKLVLFVVLPILLLGAAGGGIFASGLLDSLLGIEEHEEELMVEEEMGPSV